jgi:RNA polymerase sigma-70 factor (ECF subfamily)
MDKNTLEFQAVYDDFHPKILRYLTNIIGENEAEDLTQEVFVKVSRALGTFRGECKFSTWLYRIATNTAIDKMRISSFRQDVNIYELDDSDDTEDRLLWIDEETPSVEQSLMQKEMYQCFIEYVKNLPVNYRTIMVLSELEGFTNNEIAEVLGISLDTVKIRLHRGKTKLIQELKNNCKAEDWL